MRKLFNTGSSIRIDEFSTVHVIGPYSLLKLGPNFVTIRCEAYMIEVAGENLLVETLSEEVAVFTFEAITAMKLAAVEDEGTFYGS